MFDQMNEQKIEFQGSVLGFEHLNAFTVSVIDESGIYAYLESTEEEGIGFVVTSPFTFFSDYQFELSELDKKELSITSKEDVLALNIVTLREPFEDSTMNLLAPLVININKGVGKQLVLSGSANYQPKTKFLIQSPPSGGEISC